MAVARKKNWERCGRADLVSKIIDVLKEAYQCSDKDLGKILGLANQKLPIGNERGLVKKTMLSLL